jgi:Transglycosylase SLT domain
VPGSRINGFTLGYTALGGIILWSGIKGATLSATVKALLSGQTTVSNTQQIGTPELSVGEDNPSTAASDIADAPAYSASVANAALIKLVAAPYGWATGAQYNALTQVIAKESGGNPDAVNPDSGAYGIAQALGHGDGAATQGTVTNQYGGYGISDAVAQAANSGSATAQLTWMMAYIKEKYGTPEAAWQSEETRGYY